MQPSEHGDGFVSVCCFLLLSEVCDFLGLIHCWNAMCSILCTAASLSEKKRKRNLKEIAIEKVNAIGNLFSWSWRDTNLLLLTNSKAISFEASQKLFLLRMIASMASQNISRSMGWQMINISNEVTVRERTLKGKI